MFLAGDVLSAVRWEHAAMLIWKLFLPPLFFLLFVLTVRDNHFLSLALYGSLCAFSPAVLANKKEGEANMKIAQASSFCLLWNQ